MTLVDTNVIVDILSNDRKWFPWSAEKLRERREAGPLFINETIYAETAAGMQDEEDLKLALREMGLVLERTPSEALFLAGQAFMRYRKSGGGRTGVLPDFFIGAHATVAKLPILTRDDRRYRTYFPTAELITPSSG